MNKPKLLYFKQTNNNEITAYFKNDNRAFATFYIDKIKEVMKRFNTSEA